MHVFALLSWPFYATIVGIKLCLLLPLLWKWKYPLSTIPGPRMAAWTRLWWSKTMYFGRSAEVLIRLNREYGPVVRIGPKTVIVNDPHTIRRVLAVNSGYVRGPWFDSLRTDPRVSNVVSERDPKKHQQCRQILAGAIWMTLLDEQQRSSKESKSEFRLNLSKVLPYLSMDIITHICIDESFGNVMTDTDQYELLKTLTTAMVVQQYRASLPELNTLLLWIGRLPMLRDVMYPSANSPGGLGQLMQILEEKVRQKTAATHTQSQTRNMLDSFLSKGLDTGHAASEVLVVLFSAVGATAYTLQGIIRGIISNPSVHLTLQREIDMLVRDQGVGASDLVSDTPLRRIPYLQACISEGVRMYPVITQLREQVVPPEGDNLHGYFVPGGTFVALNGHSSQFDPTFGNDLELYQPERWLIDDRILLTKMQRNLDLNFGYGSSKCLGANLAEIEMNKTIFELFRIYSVVLGNPERPWVSRGDFVLADFNVILTKRSPHGQTNGVSCS
ncbi:cytochrome P450 [Ophiobolus disseminans]|uniref:Cytochrome P450 n=1 Tax=Ophiobolus disseminans TaxID=1469910 RepID=A0A6A7A623_9PLEO|nr:cytochrome P450 [Ophiobolus disseminans]